MSLEKLWRDRHHQCSNEKQMYKHKADRLEALLRRCVPHLRDISGLIEDAYKAGYGARHHNPDEPCLVSYENWKRWHKVKFQGWDHVTLD